MIHLDTFNLSELVAGAIRLSFTPTAEPSAEVANRVDAGLSMTTDKHRLVQILVNLISNAKQATGESPKGARPIEIDAAVSANGSVQIQVRDQGIGIDAQTMKSLFHHGFTTKSTGHGFGLHSSAIAAGDLGGTIRAESDGIGHGATFVVELPSPGPSCTEVNRAV
jgi:C4-dicarboxylate-specific signal transduction histidine kinase